MNCHAFTGRACRTKSPEYSSLPRSAAGRAFNELHEPGRGRLGRGSSCHEKLRLTDATAPRLSTHTLIIHTVRKLWRRGRGRRTGATAFCSRLPHFFLCFDELAIIRRIEIEQRATGFKMLDESFADRIGGAGREHRHDEAGGQYVDHRDRLERARRTHAAGRRDHTTGKRRDQRLTAVLRKLYVVDLRQPAQ